METGLARVLAYNFSSFFFVASIIFIAHNFSQLRTIQSLDFSNPAVKDGDSVLHSPKILGLVSEMMKNSRVSTDEDDLSRSRNETQGIVVGRTGNYLRSFNYNYPYWNRTFESDHFYATWCRDLDLLNTWNTPSLTKNATHVIYSTSNRKGSTPHEDILIPKAPLQLPCSLDELDDINTLEINNVEGFEVVQFHNMGVKYCISDDARLLECINNDSVPAAIFSSNTDAAIHSRLVKILNQTVEFPFSQT